MTKERKHSIDKLFQSSLEGNKIEPSAAVWESLSANIPANNGRGTFLFLITAIAIGAFTFFMHSTLLDSETGIAEATIDQSEIMTRGQQADLAPVVTIDIAENESTSADQQEQSIAIENPKTNEVSAIAQTSTNSSIEEKNRKSESTIVSTASPAREEQKSLPAPTQEALIEYDYVHRLAPIPAQLNAGSENQINTREDANPGEARYGLSMKDTYVRKAEVLFGASFSPAVNIYPERQNQNDYSFDIVAAYEKSRFIVETGLGANFTSESAKYQINYTTYDSIGFYIGVSSFTTDPANSDSIIFETNLKSIYDSIDHYQIQENTNKYVYLQIPIRIGYRVVQLDRFSLDLKAGLLFSLQIHKDVPGVPYQGNDTDQIDVIRQYPDRLSTYWQYTASVSFNYQINNQVRFSLEPFYRQCLKSTYSPSSVYPAKSPYGFGLRAGIYFHF